MQTSPQGAEAGAGWQAVSKETEAGTGMERARDDGSNIIGCTDVGTEARTRMERASYDGARKIVWTDVGAGGRGWASSAVEGTKVICGQASLQRQGDCGDTGLHSGGVTLITL